MSKPKKGKWGKVVPVADPPDWLVRSMEGRSVGSLHCVIGFGAYTTEVEPDGSVSVWRVVS